MARIISLAEAQRLLGDVVVCLEPDDIREAKRGTSDEPTLWIWDPATGTTRRGDNKYFDVPYVRRGAYGHPVIRQEPLLPDPPEGARRVHSHVIVETNAAGLVRVRQAQGLNGPILELKPSSVSKGELAGGEETPVGYFEADPQRISGGVIAVYHRKNVDFPDSEGMPPRAFVALSTDGRSVSALVRAGLLY